MVSAVSAKSDGQPTVRTLERRARAILGVRPAYKETVGFYLSVFRRQIDWRDRLEVSPEEVDADGARKCFRDGKPLAERYDPGISSASLVALWTEMKDVFRQGNDVLRDAVGKIQEAETNGRFAPAAWLPEQDPRRFSLVAEAARAVGVEETVLATLTRAATFPHWQRVSQAWLPAGRTEGWRRFTCPVCGGAPALAETRAGPTGCEDLKPAAQRWMHCSFCGARWLVAALECPACGSTETGDARYLFTAEEPELRVDFCKSCRHYVKTIDGDKVGEPIHVGLELLTAAHLDVLAREKHLLPLDS